MPERQVVSYEQRPRGMPAPRPAPAKPAHASRLLGRTSDPTGTVVCLKLVDTGRLLPMRVAQFEDRKRGEDGPMERPATGESSQAQRHAEQAQEKMAERREGQSGVSGWVAGRASEWSLDGPDYDFMAKQKFLWNTLMDYWFRTPASSSWPSAAAFRSCPYRPSAARTRCPCWPAGGAWPSSWPLTRSRA
jgi:hypothetical protein